jgi:hypothetical protein
MLTLQPLLRGLRALTPCAVLALVAASIPSFVTTKLLAQRSNIASRAFTALSATDTEATLPMDAGPLPTSQTVTITMRLAQTPARSAALDQFLASVITKSSSDYHKWLTPQQFAASYGSTEDQIATVTTWAQSQGLSVGAISPAKTRIILSGTADQVQRAFAVSLHRYVVSGTARFANSSAPSVPLTIAPMIVGVSGLDDLPITPAAVSAVSLIGRVTILSAADSDPLLVAASAVDANLSPVLILKTVSCSADISPADSDAYQALFRQATAQGITILATNTCASSANTSLGTPGQLLTLPEVTALNLSAAESADTALALTEARPGWQVAPGLPADAMRHQPDLTAASVADFSQTLTTLERETGTRQGNINSILYSLASSPGLYSQPDSAPAGTWEAQTGLGTIDLAVLAKVFPRVTGSFATTTSLSSSSYAVTYGQAFVLTSKVLAPVYTNANPSGTVVFTSGTQGVIGNATVDSTGAATLNLSTGLAVGAYTITATYSGDANYAVSSSTSAVIVTVSIANGIIVATISPSSNVPYGSTATVTATVTLPSSNLPPTGAVSAAVQGVTGAVANATLTPNPGGNSATANIVVVVPPPGTYTVQVTCTGTTNFLCQTPINIAVTTIKGNTNVNLTATPVAPQAGQPVTLTAFVSSAGNGPGPYNFTGTMIFYDNGKIIGSGAVASNQASASITLAGNVTHSIVASYSGDTNWSLSTSTPQTINPTLLPSTITLSSNVSSALAGVNVVFTATVFTTVANTVGPTGTISFYDTFNGSIVQLGGTTGSITLTPNGPNQSIARLTTTGLLPGVHSIYAIYNGDANFAPATSLSLPMTMTDYTVTMIPQTITVKAGQSGQVVMLLGMVGGFNGTVSFGCTPPSGAEATCSFSPTSLQGGGSTTMSITTTAAKAKPVQQANGKSGSWPLGAGSALAFALCFMVPRRRRAVPLLLTALLMVGLFPGLGCGLGGNAPASPTATTDSGTPLGTQTFTITTAGNDGINTARHTYQYQVTIQ